MLSRAAEDARKTVRSSRPGQSLRCLAVTDAVYHRGPRRVPAIALAGAPVIHGMVDGPIWLLPFSPHGLGGTRSLPDLLYGLGPLGWVRVPSRRHRDQHPG